ncbi:MAG TPA: trypsin-like peptidase domain-containing protein [Burkholderiales bacterium]|nr:trypsin-like peptidase domain-containing protein [Burkholderiales bacterium]
MSWHDACEKVTPYIVKVETPAGSGTGFFFAYNADRALVAVATALHVVQDAEDWRQPIKIVQGEKEVFVRYDDRAVLVDRERDSAAILLPAHACRSGGIVVPESMLTLLQKDYQVKVGVALGWAGYPALAPKTLCFFQGGVSAFNRADDSYFIDGVAINGVSGGPVFEDSLDEGEKAVRLVGIVSAYFANRQRGDTLPGLLIVHDVTHLHETIERVKSRDEARRKEEQSKEKARGAAADAKPAEGRQGPQEPNPKKAG